MQHVSKQRKLVICLPPLTSASYTFARLSHLDSPLTTPASALLPLPSTMKSLVCLLALSAILLPSLAAPAANRDLVVSSDGQDSLAYADGLNITLQPQDIITSLSRREAFNSSAAMEKDYGFGPLKYFTWRMQLQAREIRKLLSISPHLFPSAIDDQLIRQGR